MASEGMRAVICCFNTEITHDMIGFHLQLGVEVRNLLICFD